MIRSLLVILCAGCAGAAPVPPHAARAELVYGWTRVAYDFRTPDEARAYEAGEVYKHAMVAGVHIARDGRMFVSTPRWMDARVPATLSEIVVERGEPVLRPFPSWDAQSLANPSGLRSVLGFAIDDHNRMWILDMGWVAGETQAPAGGQKLVVLDLGTGRELARYAFPDEVANPATSFLNDLAIDAPRGLAYVSDSGNRAGSPTASGIIIYDLAHDTARRVLDRDPHVQDDPTRTLFVEGEQVLPSGRLAVGINGIALSPDGEHLYWSITTGDAVYEAPTRALTPDAIHGPWRIGGGSDGITVDRAGRIYVTDLAHDAIVRIDPHDGSQTIVVAGPELAWPDTLTWDSRGRLYVSTNHLNHGFAGTMRFDTPTPNFRILRIPTDAPKE